MTLDTYKAVQDLKKAGLEEEKAAAFVAVIRWAATGQYTSYAGLFAKSGDVCESVDSEHATRP